MQFLIQLQLSPSQRPIRPEDGIAFIEDAIFPTLELCNKLATEGRILAGGPLSGTVALALVAQVESAQELDDLVSSLPVWPRMETQVTPLTTFEGRRETLLPRLKALKAQALKTPLSTTGGRQ